ncbi:hypothetical protein J3D61_006316 [Bacillus cereus]|nr:hypothetical protein [Bacillus cereus]
MRESAYTEGLSLSINYKIILFNEQFLQTISKNISNLSVVTITNSKLVSH